MPENSGSDLFSRRIDRMLAAASIERETDPSRFQVIAMSLKAPFERLGDKLSQPHSTQPASAITRLKSASGKSTVVRIKAYLHGRFGMTEGDLQLMTCCFGRSRHPACLGKISIGHRITP